MHETRIGNQRLPRKITAMFSVKRHKTGKQGQWNMGQLDQSILSTVYTKFQQLRYLYPFIVSLGL